MRSLNSVEKLALIKQLNSLYESQMEDLEVVALDGYVMIKLPKESDKYDMSFADLTLEEINNFSLNK